jgi:hypothetical protein
LYKFQAHLVAIVPLLSSRYVDDAPLVEVTQFFSVVEVLSHFYVCYYAPNYYGVCTAVAVLVLALALSIPTDFRYHFVYIARYSSVVFKFWEASRQEITSNLIFSISAANCWKQLWELHHLLCTKALNNWLNILLTWVIFLDCIEIFLSSNLTNFN